MLVACGPGLFWSILAEFLAAKPDLAVSATGADCAELSRQVLRDKPHVILVDVATFATNGASFERVATSGAGTRVLLMASRADTVPILDALRRGAWGVVYNEAAPAELVELVRAAAAGKVWEDQKYASRLLHSLRAGPTPTGTGDQGPPLTLRERQLIAELAAGATNADIARTLGLHPQTVKNRLSAIFDKLGVSSRLELALYAVHHDLAERVTGDGLPRAGTTARRVPI